jgi:hypothetical protein
MKTLRVRDAVEVILIITLIVATFSLRMVYAQEGVPVSGAFVIAVGDEGYSHSVTNSTGNFVMSRGLSTGDYDISVTAEGYLRRERIIHVISGFSTPNINFYLFHSGGIYGVVRDKFGLPVKNLTVYAISQNFGYTWTSISGKDGYYGIATNLGTDIYDVYVTNPKGYISSSRTDISVIAGLRTENVDFALHISGMISGKITASDGSPLPSVLVNATHGEYRGSASTDFDGNYLIDSGLAAGSYTVTAMFQSVYAVATNVSVVVGQETAGVNLEIMVSPPAPSGRINGVVTDADGNPVVGAEIAVYGYSGYGNAITDEKGKYVISKGLGSGNYTVTASAKGLISQNKTDVNVIVGEGTGGVNFQLTWIPQEESGTISGFVLGDPNPIPEFTTLSLYAVFFTITVIVVALKIWRKNRVARDLDAIGDKEVEL